MSVFKKTALYVAWAAVAGLFFTGCNNNPIGVPPPGPGVDFKDFKPRSILVENRTNKKLVAFKGNVLPSNLISGVPAYAINHGLKKDGVFTKTESFPLILITEEDYNTYKSNLNAAPIFTQMFCFYNHEADNNNVFIISSRAGGKGQIKLENPTSWNIEIRSGGPTGEVLGYAAANLLTTVLRLEIPVDYDLFPVFKRYNPSDREIYEIVPKYPENSINVAFRGKPFAQSFGLNDETMRTWNFTELESQLNFTMTTGGFYVRIRNQASTDLRLMRGDVAQNTSTGVTYIRNSTDNLYNIKVGRNPDGTYPPTQVFGTLSISAGGAAYPIPEHTYKTDYIYTITITGANAANLVVGNIEESAEPIDIEAKFNM